jgi:copper transport protein
VDKVVRQTQGYQDMQNADLRGAKVRILSFLAAILIGLMLSAGQASAHAVLEQASPEPNARLTAGPSHIELRFNEAIESSVGSVEVLDSLSNTITKNKPELSGDRKSLTLELPRLVEGIYTVSYRVVSADGHPVAGSYPFIVGNPPEAKDASAFDIHSELGHAGHSGVATELTKQAFLTYTVRAAYYAALLLGAGFMLWLAVMRRRASAYGEAAHDWFKQWGLWITRALIVAVLLHVFVHSNEVMEGQPLADWPRLFTSTSVGLAWAGALVLAFIGPLVRRAGSWVGVLWALSLLALESWSGHASAYEPLAYAMLLDYAHLAASALWAGGLALLVGLWFKDRKEAGRFAAAFSDIAWICIALLTLTGIAEALLFLPKLSYLFYTGWGALLVAKTVLVLLVIVTGALLRLRIRKGELPRPSLLKLDAGLMAAIIIIVGLFTYISPLPENEPVRFHKMGEDMHLSLRVTPNVPGENDFVVKVWLPEAVGQPKSVTLRLRSEDRSELGPIEVPLQAYEDEEFDAFTGYVKATYESEGPYIPFAGRWLAEIRVLDNNDNELIHTEPFRNY